MIVSESYVNVLRVAVLVSGNGTNLQAIIDQIHSGFLADVEIVKVIATREQAFALKRAEKNRIPFAVVSRSLFATQAEYDRALMDELSQDAVDLIVLAGFLSKLGPDFFKAFPDVINVHPSLIPSFCGQGMYGLKVHEAVLAAGVKVTGATVHRVDEEYDSGPILMQTPIPIRENDTPESLQKRVMEEGEHVILPQAIRIYADKKFKKDWKKGNIMKRAIISVSDKKDIVEFAKELSRLGIDIISTGGTAALLQKSGVCVTEVAKITEFPECLDGRVKTLHPNIHAGILAIRDNFDHMEKIKELGIEPIDFVIINLYPFKETIIKPESDFDTCIENIDIGGPSMLRAAAKNHRDVTVITDPCDYIQVIEELKRYGETSYETRKQLAKKVFEHTAAYDTLIADYLRVQSGDENFPQLLSFTYEKIQNMRYGENPHQRAAFYKNAVPIRGTLPLADQMHGKELSYNNIADTDACLTLLKEFDEPTVVAVKHANPCGVGSSDTIYKAWRKAYEADTISIYGGIVAANREIDDACAKEMAEIFLEVIVAPSYTDHALEILKTKKNLRILKLTDITERAPQNCHEVKKIGGGILVQEPDRDDYDIHSWKTVTETAPESEQTEDLVFAMKVVKHVKSNAIVLVKDKQTIGIGPGQPNRITSVAIAIGQAKELSHGAVMASDAFFPFSDCVKAAADAGIASIIQPGGSIRDDESIRECNERGISMTFTGVRHFKH